MIVVSDTSPLNYLSIIRRAELLHAIFGDVFIPPAVARELSDARAPAATRALVEAPPPWLIVQQAAPAAVDEVGRLCPRLGAGEIEAISLAVEIRADLLLTDERRATRIARERYNLRATGLLGVLELAAIRGLIALPLVIDELRGTTFRMPEALINQVLRDDARRGE